MVRKGTMLLLLLFTGVSLTAQIKLPALFTDNMVLQRNSEVSVWGWGDYHYETRVTGSWSKDTITTSVSTDLTWRVTLKTPEAGGPYELCFMGKDTITLENIMIGEVWLCSGQSNMELTAEQTFYNSAFEVANAHHPNIRLFNVKRTASQSTQENCFGEWEVCSPRSMKSFSALGYFFGRHLQQHLDIPIGLINASLGGTPAEVWVSKEVVTADPVLQDGAERLVKYDWKLTEPGVVYNAMIAPLMPFTIAGTIWFQGEGNAETPETYQTLFTTLIESWREGFNNDFPFYYVQISPYAYEPQYHAPYIREAQAKCLAIPKTGMVLFSDFVDDINEGHPRNKQQEGERLGNYVLADMYGIKGIAYKSPLYESFNVKNNKIRVTFVNADKGLIARGEKLQHFEVAGEDRVFYPADAKIDGNTVLIWAKEVKAPVAARYAFSNDAIGNLFSREGIPVSPFRTDNW